MESGQEITKGAFDRLGPADKKEFTVIRDALVRMGSEKTSHGKVDDELKERVAKLCLRLIDKTPDSEISRMATAYIIGSFIQYTHLFDSNLRDAIDTAAQLEVPPRLVMGDARQLWGKMQADFESEIRGVSEN